MTNSKIPKSEKTQRENRESLHEIRYSLFRHWAHLWKKGVIRALPNAPCVPNRSNRHFRFFAGSRRVGFTCCRQWEVGLVLVGKIAEQAC